MTDLFKEKYKYISVLIFSIILCISLIPNTSQAADDSVNVELIVTGCNNNGICEAILGESELSCPLDCTTTEEPGSGSYSSGSIGTEFKIHSIKENIDLENALVTISWQTSLDSKSVLYYGKSQDHNLYTYSGIYFTKVHQSTIQGIEPGLHYYLIESTSKNGRVETSNLISFFIPAKQEVQIIDNVTNFRSFLDNSGIGLAWENPDTIDFSRVRLVGSVNTYPRTHLDGEVVYEGTSESFIDTDVVPGQEYFYSIFAIDDSGGASSGMVLSSKYQIEGQQDQDDDSGEIEYTGEIKENYVFKQNNENLDIVDSIVIIDENKPLTIEIDEKYINKFDTIVIYFQTNYIDKNNPGYKLKYYEEENVYKVVIPEFLVDGEINFEIKKYKSTGKLRSVEKGVLFIQLIEDSFTEKYPSYLKSTKYYPLLILLILILILILILSKKVKKY